MGVKVASDNLAKGNLVLPGSSPTPDNLPNPSAPPPYQRQSAVKIKSNLKRNLRGFIFGMLFIALIVAVTVLAVKFNDSQQALIQCRMNQQMNGWRWDDDRYNSESVEDFIANLYRCIDLVNRNVDWRCLRRMIRSRRGEDSWFEDSDDDWVEK